MPQTAAILLAILRYLAAPAISGAIASWLFDRLRAEVPPGRAAGASPLTRGAIRLLHAPRFARPLVLLLSALISLPATAGIVLLAGQDLAALDTALAAVLTALASQLWHALTLSAELPEPPEPKPADDFDAPLAFVFTPWDEEDDAE